MGTRSRIGVMHGDVIKSVYCHWDGYLEHNGAILLEHYGSVKANNLVALGDLSSLHPEIGEQHPFSHHDVEGMSLEQYNELYDDMCVFYGRDRGESDVGYKVAHTLEEFLDQCKSCDAEYYYIMKDGQWLCGDTYGKTDISNKLTSLAGLVDQKEAA
jgi:hypothetical protein